MLRGSSDLVLLAVGANEALARDASGSAGSFGLHMRPSGADFDALVARAARVAGCEDQARAAELWQTASALSLRCRTPSTHVLTRRAFTLLANDPELGRGTLAKYAQCHPTELSRHFHRDVGITLVRYRTRLRLLSLMRTMDTGANNLVRAALSAGFGSYSQCHRAFVAELGCSPSAFFSGDLRRGMESRFEPA
jgi:AraC-like DNA-binding protein